MKAVNLNPSYAEVTLLASTAISNSTKIVSQILRLTEMLGDLDDVQNVYSNVEIIPKKYINPVARISVTRNTKHNS